MSTEAPSGDYVTGGDVAASALRGCSRENTLPGMRAMKAGKGVLFSALPQGLALGLCPGGDGAAERNSASRPPLPAAGISALRFRSLPLSCFLFPLLKGCPRSGPRGMRQRYSFQCCGLPGEPRSCRLTIVGENMFPHVVGYLLSK